MCWFYNASKPNNLSYLYITILHFPWCISFKTLKTWQTFKLYKVLIKSSKTSQIYLYNSLSSQTINLVTEFLLGLNFNASFLFRFVPCLLFYKNNNTFLFFSIDDFLIDGLLFFLINSFPHLTVLLNGYS